MNRTLLAATLPVLFALAVGCGSGTEDSSPRDGAGSPASGDQPTDGPLAGWVEHTSQAGAFTVLVPTEPAVSPTKDFRSGEVVGENVIASTTDGMCQIIHNPFSAQWLEPGMEAEAVFAEKELEWAAGSVRREQTAVDGRPAWIFHSDHEDGLALNDMYVVGADRVYQVRITGKTTFATDERTQAYFESFRFTDSPAGQP